MSLSVISGHVQYLVKPDAAPDPGVPTISYEFVPQLGVSYGSRCYYVYATDGVADFDDDPDAATFLRMPSDDVLREGFCRETEICVTGIMGYPFTIARVINPFQVAESATYTFSPQLAQLPIEAPVVSYLFTPSVPIVHRWVGTHFEQPYGLEVGVAGMVQPYAINFPVPQHTVQLYGLEIAKTLEQDVGYLQPPITNISEQPYSLEEFSEVAASIGQPYALTVLNTISATYSLLEPISNILVCLYGDLVEVETSFIQSYDLLSMNSIGIGLEQPYTLAGATIPDSIDSDTAYVTVDGGRVSAQSIQLDQPFGAFAWTVSFILEDLESYKLLPINKPFTLTVLGTVFDFIVDSRDLTRGELTNGSIETVSIAGISPTAVLQAPKASPYSKVWQTTATAKVIVEEVLADAGFMRTLHWNITDWSIPGNRVAVDKGDPISVIQKIAEASGAHAVTNNAGHLVIDYVFPVWPGKWDDTNAQLSLNEIENIFSVSESEEFLAWFNSVRVRDVKESLRDVLVWEADDTESGSVLSGNLLAYLAPYREGTFLTTTGGAVIGAKTTEFREYEEDVEIVQGVGGVQHPIHDILSIVWYEKSLAGLGFVQYSNTVTTDTTDPIAYSVARIKYRSKIDVYQATYSKSIPSDDTIPSQFLLQEQD